MLALLIVKMPPLFEDWNKCTINVHIYAMSWQPWLPPTHTHTHIHISTHRHKPALVVSFWEPHYLNKFSLFPSVLHKHHWEGILKYTAAKQNMSIGFISPWMMVVVSMLLVAQICCNGECLKLVFVLCVSLDWFLLMLLLVHSWWLCFPVHTAAAI